jgi:hypothetical protein
MITMTSTVSMNTAPSSSPMYRTVMILMMMVAPRLLLSIPGFLTLAGVRLAYNKT